MAGEYKQKAADFHKQAKSAASKGIFKSPDFDKAATLYRDASTSACWLRRWLIPAVQPSTTSLLARAARTS